MSNNPGIYRKSRTHAGVSLNYDISSYEFMDIDLEISVQRLPTRDQRILVLYLMGHSQEDIAISQDISRSMVSKRLSKIRNILSGYMR